MDRFRNTIGNEDSIMAMTGTLVKRHGFGIIEGVFSLVASGSYATGGDTLDFAPIMGYTNKQPTVASVWGIAGFLYTYNLATGKVMVFTSGQAAGTISAPSFTIGTGTHGAGLTIGLSTATVAGTVQGGTAFASEVVLTTTSPVGAPTFTGSAAAALTELAAGAYPAGVTGDTILARATWFQ